jgi:ferredoxin
VRCGLCGTVCENGCIRFFGADEHAHGAFTPYLDVRRRACTLCMRCTEVCPSGALTKVADTKAAILAHVRMGKAVVDPEHCLSYLGRLCGYCHDACPYPGEAPRLLPPALPVVLDACVGCGRCVEDCPQSPTAIRVERSVT